MASRFEDEGRWKDRIVMRGGGKKAKSNVAWCYKCNADKEFGQKQLRLGERERRCKDCAKEAQVEAGRKRAAELNKSSEHQAAAGKKRAETGGADLFRHQNAKIDHQAGAGKKRAGAGGADLLKDLNAKMDHQAGAGKKRAVACTPIRL